MMQKPSSSSGYPPELAVEARRMCLYVATLLGDLKDDVVVVGGLVPYLIIDQAAAVETHVGTRDLDLGLALSVLDAERYHEISEQLRRNGFAPDLTDDGKTKRQTWRLGPQRVTIDFLIAQSNPDQKPGTLQSLERDFAAMVTPALTVAFTDFLDIVIDDQTPAGELACRTVKVCGPAAFVVLKAHAFHNRSEPKDAYDLVYVLKHFGNGDGREIADRFSAIAVTQAATDALAFLAADFASPAHLGAIRAAAFVGGSGADVRAEAYGYVQEFLKLVHASAAETKGTA
jgi:hypothetical protein